LDGALDHVEAAIAAARSAGLAAERGEVVAGAAPAGAAATAVATPRCQGTEGIGFGCGRSYEPR
jgi:hypothetical protein